ncbi:TRAP-type C4-dicarboxylate transport system permease small subunit [Modicisalibacter xianhensis]|uniref:TRAP transporter small permease protein n=1 Tax=Modicisalibacter xianhensis TaxID=442341 RepID=A0A4R8FAX0_9GAMM|nr:TRAP transporter small permease [Halomonas xianhensis]TDX22850.1 TRAP-type C4-dicarboxylate transport system permease small subunit [Halomonas xianhensis]
MRAIVDLFTSIDNALAAVMKVAVVVMGLFVSFALVFGIVSRSFLGVQVFGLEELVLTAAMWLYMLGAAMASRERSHLSADFIEAFSKNETLKEVIHLIATTLSLVMAVFFVTWSYSLFAWGLEKGQVTPVFSIPQYVSQSSLFVASVLLLLYMLRDFIHDVGKLFFKS